MDYFKTEVKTGTVILVCLALLIVLTVGISGTKTLGRTYTLTVLFKNIGGLAKDAPVNFAGLQVGKVKLVRLTTKKERELYPEYNIAVKMSINNQAVVKKNSVAQIRTLGYLGLKYIDITPGTPESEVVKHGATVLGFTPQDINDIIDEIGKFIKRVKPKIERILDGIQNIVGPEGSLTTAINEFEKLVKDADEVVVINRDDIRALIANLKQTSVDFKEFAADIKEHPWKLLIKTREKKSKGDERPKPRKRRERQNWKR